MAKYYSKETLKMKVSQLSEAMGWKLELIGCNGCYAVSGTPFSFLGWYRTVKDQIIFIEGVLNGIKFLSND